MKFNWPQLIQDLRSESGDRFNDAWKTLTELADETTVPRLYSLLTDESISVRETAAHALSRLEGVRALSFIFQAYTLGLHEWYEENEGMTKIIVDILQANQEEAAPLLLDLLNSKDIETLQTVAWALGFVASQVSPMPLFELINNHTDFRIRAAAVGSLRYFKDSPEVFDQLLLLLDDPNFHVRDTAAIALGEFGNKNAIGPLQERQKNAAENEQMSIYFALEKLLKS